MLHVLDLCAGTESVRRSLELIYGADNLHYTSVDNMPKFNPTHCTDIRTWDFRSALDGQHFDVVWASPPCREYSRAKTIGRRDYDTADGIVRSCWEIIEFVKPARWFMENPATGYLHRRPFMAEYDHLKNTCCYCRYGRDFKKPTHIWSNRADLHLLTCCKATPCEHKRLTNKHPFCSQTGSRAGVAFGGVKAEIAYEIPQALIQALFQETPPA